MRRSLPALCASSSRWVVTRARAHRLQAKLEAQGWPTRTVVDAETGARREVDLDEAGRRAYLAEQLALGFELDATRIDADETRKFITKGLVNSLWGVSAACMHGTACRSLASGPTKSRSSTWT